MSNTLTTASYDIKVLGRSADGVWSLEVTGRHVVPVNDGVWTCHFPSDGYDVIVSPHGDRFVNRQIEQALPGSVVNTIARLFNA